MNARPRSLHSLSVHSSQVKHRGSLMNNLSGNDFDSVDASRRAFANMLWRAFPAKSENELAEKAARVLDVSDRQVKNWLRCENSAAIQYFFAVAAIAGAEVVFNGGR